VLGTLLLECKGVPGISPKRFLESIMALTTRATLLDLPKKIIQVLIASPGICLLKLILCASGLFGEGKS